MPICVGLVVVCNDPIPVCFGLAAARCELSSTADRLENVCSTADASCVNRSGPAKYAIASVLTAALLASCGSRSGEVASSIGNQGGRSTVPLPDLVVDGECASVRTPADGEVIGESCFEAGLQPRVLWSGPYEDTYVALLRLQEESRLEAIKPAERFVVVEPQGEFAVVEIGSGPATSAVVHRQFDVVECKVFDAATDCVPR